MAEYTLQELKNKMTDKVYENHMRLIEGPTIQEILHDTVDSLKKYIDDNDQEPAENYYVNQIGFNVDTGVLTLTRAGGIDPPNISKDLDGRYVTIPDFDNFFEGESAGKKQVDWASFECQPKRSAVR